MNFKQFCSTQIIFSNKEELKERLISLDSSNIVLLISKTASSRWGLLDFIEKLEASCQSRNGNLIWVNKIPSNPTQSDIIQVLRQIGDSKVDTIVAIGGGSCIDLAKGISAFLDFQKNTAYTNEEITQSIINKKYKENFTDIIAVPTTAGTGSELTQWATIWDDKKAAKFSIDHMNLKPKLAIIVPELTLSMPSNMTLSTGLDSMCQAIEAYWSKHTNPMVQEIAYRSVELSLSNLRQAIEFPNDIKARENLCRASVLAGIAFSQTRTTACHSISYPLTMLYDVPHGLAVAITLDEVAKLNRGHFMNDEELFRLFHEYGGIKNWVDMVCEDVIDMRLSAFGVTKINIARVVDRAFTEGRMDNNPVHFTIETVRNILLNVL
jgi:alcohol dehydrogenase class IV